MGPLYAAKTGTPEPMITVREVLCKWSISKLRALWKWIVAKFKR